jgi:hypothetical protein
MTKAKSEEEHKKAEEEQKRAFRLEIKELDHGCISVKSPIILSKEQYNLIQKVCDITGETIQQYIKDALITTIDTDLSDPTCFGQTVCKVLREEWDPVKPK